MAYSTVAHRQVWRCTITIALFLMLSLPADAACGDTSPFVGFSDSLSTMEHDVSGKLTIEDDCTFTVDDFTYDGDAPAAYWWAGKSCSQSDLQDGFRLSNNRLIKPYNGDSFTISVDSGIRWDDVGCICVWCEDYNANFGDVTLKAVSSSKPPPVEEEEEEEAPKPAPKPSPQPVKPSPTNDGPPAAAPACCGAVEAKPPPPVPSPSTDEAFDLPNCIELLPGYYNLWWDINQDDNTMLIGLEGMPGPGNKWLGFGFSASNATDVYMPGSDVVVGGVVNGECFAFDYYLSSRSQCDWATGDGVCPDPAGGSGGTSQVELIECNQIGDKLTVLMSRPLSNGATVDAIKDQDWSSLLSGESFTVWAMGPVSEGSNSTRPVVLYHNFILPGMTEVMSVHAPKGENYKVNLSQKGNFCPPLVPIAASGPAAAPRTPPAVISGETTFQVTEGDANNYPNPPSWGVAYWINGKADPVLNVIRGTEYTFIIKAGDQHPMYITDSIIGGSSTNGFEGETVFAGGIDSHGTEESPYTLTWTPDPDTPDLVYYQCAVHQKFGWEIRVFDSAGEANASNADQAPGPEEASAASTAGILTVATVAMMVLVV